MAAGRTRAAPAGWQPRANDSISMVGRHGAPQALELLRQVRAGQALAPQERFARAGFGAPVRLFDVPHGAPAGDRPGPTITTEVSSQGEEPAR